MALPDGTRQSGEAEHRLLEVFQKVDSSDLDGALASVERLTDDLPHFQAAHLVEADLLGLRSGLSPSIGAQESLLGSSRRAEVVRLQQLQEELKRRLQAHQRPPHQGSVPREFLRVSDSVRHAIAIDASKSRLYLFANEGLGLRIIGDYYISVGILGVDKRREGDQRTPLGIYFTNGQIPGQRLPDFYGKGALPLNYPNGWDRSLGRSGSGIWLHGTPPDQFARTPLASDGCIVLSNPDMQFLLDTVDSNTPVLIRDSIEWTDAWQAFQENLRPDPFMETVRDWERVRRAQSAQKLEAVYEPGFLRAPGKRRQLQQYSQHYAASDFAVQEVSVYGWTDAQGEVKVVTHHSTSSVSPDGLSVRQYWHQRDGQWKILTEDVLARPLG